MTTTEPGAEPTRTVRVTERIELADPDGATLVLEPGDEIQITGPIAAAEGRVVVGMKVTAPTDDEEG